MSFPRIPCQAQNHYGMNYEYVCFNEECLRNLRELSCMCCCQQLHSLHSHKVTALPIFLASISRAPHSNLLEALLEGLPNCYSEKQFRLNISELIAFVRANRTQAPLDHEVKQLSKLAVQHYHTSRPEISLKTSTRSHRLSKPLITPIFQFNSGQHYRLNSPFCITNSSTSLTTALASPSLSKFYESVECSLRAEKCTPAWLGIGLSISESRYQQASQNHILCISNGWANTLGKMEKTKLKFGVGDTVRVRWDKNTQTVEFAVNGHRHSARLEEKWTEEVFLCVVMYYKNDSVTILA